MTPPPLVSVVIAAYNASATLAETIASVAAQTCRDFELVVVDDGSRDTTPQILAAQAELHPWLRWVRQANAGASAARESGIALARGEWVAFLDADDLWLPSKLERQLQGLAQHPAASLSCTDVVDFIGDADLPQTRFVQKAPARGNVLRELFTRNFITTSTVLVRKRALVAVGGFDRALKVNEDFDLWLRLAEGHEFDYVDEVLVRYRVLPTSLTRANQKECYLQDLAIIQKWVERRPDVFAAQSALVRCRRGVILGRLAYQLLAERNFREARATYLQAYRLGQRDRGTLLRMFASFVPPAAELFWRLKRLRG